MYGALNLFSSNVTNNAATGYGGKGGGKGGGVAAVMAFGSVVVTDSIFDYNRADYGSGGGGLNVQINNLASLVVQNSHFLYNSAGYGPGGGLSIHAGDTVDVAISGTTVTRNFAQAGGGGVYLAGDQASFSVSGSDLGLNQATSSGASGGGLLAYLDNSELHLNAASFIYNYNNGSITSDGGGAYVRATDSELTIEASSFIGNQARGCGGGLDISGQPSLVSIGGSRFVNNSAYVCGGGVNLVATTLQNALVEIKYSEISTNVAAGNLIGGTFRGGGGVNIALGDDSLFRLQNSTISTNVAGQEGGGVSLNGSMTAEIKYSTVANNRTMDQGAGIYNGASGCIIDNSILDGNSTYSPISQEIWGSVNCGVSNSLITAATTSLFDDNGGNVLNQAALLAALANNGGPTRTHALLPGSPAIDAGSVGPIVPDHDQRGPGFPRVRGSTIDMGAFESFSDFIFRDRFNANP